jgi:hypothetical protein
MHNLEIRVRGWILRAYILVTTLRKQVAVSGASAIVLAENLDTRIPTHDFVIDPVVDAILSAFHALIGYLSPLQQTPHGPHLPQAREKT